ncbi:MAG: hypothetical protein KatS3mg051_2001 [Anaerolineae bacterium]|nr:MAG: hypothetical protein KatS3mg051_2001 [Anaerolineae bacterium]
MKRSALAGRQGKVTKGDVAGRDGWKEMGYEE